MLWGPLLFDGTFDAAADLLYACTDAHADTAYSSGDASVSVTRAVLAALAAEVRALISTDLEGAELASEVVTALRDATPPSELVVHSPPAARRGAIRGFLSWKLGTPSQRADIEARLLRRALPGAASVFFSDEDDTLALCGRCCADFGLTDGVIMTVSKSVVTPTSSFSARRGVERNAVVLSLIHI